MYISGMTKPRPIVHNSINHACFTFQGWNMEGIAMFLKGLAGWGLGMIENQMKIAKQLQKLISYQKIKKIPTAVQYYM